MSQREHREYGVDRHTCRREPRSLPASAHNAAKGIADTISTPATSVHAAIGARRFRLLDCSCMSRRRRLPGAAAPTGPLPGSCVPDNAACKDSYGPGQMTLPCPVCTPSFFYRLAPPRLHGAERCRIAGITFTLHRRRRKLRQALQCATCCRLCMPAFATLKDIF